MSRADLLVKLIRSRTKERQVKWKVIANDWQGKSNAQPDVDILKWYIELCEVFNICCKTME